MKLSRSRIALAASAVILAAVLQAELAHIEATSPLQAVFFKLVPSGPAKALARRPSSETRPELAKLIAVRPADGELYSLRALEAERQLDFGSAEADWIKHAQLAGDKFSGQIALADYYQRRLEPAKEVKALHEAAVLPAQAAERYTPAMEQKSWRAFERMTAAIDDHLLGFDAARAEHRAWIARYPNESAAYVRVLDYAVAHKQYGYAEQYLKQYSAAFPTDAVYPVKAQAEIEASRGSAQAALALYDRGFNPLWPAELIKAYFEQLKSAGALRRYLADARAKGNSIDGAARIFYYWQQQGNVANAQHALIDYEARKPAQSWKADELWTLAQLYEAANNPDRAARCYYSLYSQPNAQAADAERALAGLTNLLFANAGQGIRFGSSDLTYYRDIAQADPYPGYLNGVLSLILNSTGPAYAYSDENQKAQPYFQRAKASELVTLFDSRFPNSTRRPGLHLSRIQSFATYGDNQAVIRAGGQFRAQFANAAERTQVATLMADAYARTNQMQQEFALYNELLRELSRRADGVPLGEHGGAAPAAPKQDQPQEQGDAATPAEPREAPKRGARSPEYARILDRYLARLVNLKRIPDALALYRQEIDRNPNDPGLYERFAGFLEQNRLGADVEATYKRAISQFPDTSWSHKLARWYLKQKQTAQFTQLSREVAEKFSGAELERYFSEAVPRGSVAAALYLQLNLYAHQRFPNDLAFTRNLLTAYSTRGSADAVAYESLLRASWFQADDLRVRFFEYLARNRKLDAELAALGSIGSQQQVNANPVGARMLAEGESWRTNFEAAAPVFHAIAASYPTADLAAPRAVAIYRSLATIDPKHTDTAAALEQSLVAYAPGDSVALTYAGEIQADRERFDRARPLWNRIATTEPGKAERYLESATVFWDYFLFDDALRVIDEGRRKLNDPAMHAYQAGAIYESKRQYDRALSEYASAAFRQANDQAQRRLVRLARRPSLRDSVERLTVQAATAANAGPREIGLRTAVLENQGRRADMEQTLLSAAGRATAFETLDWVETQGRIGGFPAVQEAAMTRRVAITTDPVDQVRLQLGLAHFYEDQARPNDAQRVLSALLRTHPSTLGVVRAVTDFYWRSGQPKNAVTTLTAAANGAQPFYQKSFRLEAARKATESGDTTTARQTLALLLKDDPYRSEYLSAMADTYARAGDDRGLRTFYQATIDGLRASNLTASDRTERTAAMRRGLIPVLTRVKDYSSALDQYVEVLNRYPDDSELTREAAAYAGAHQMSEKLIAYYVKTAAASPKDSRWPIVLARLETELEKFPEAVESYSKALAIRPERADLWNAQAALDETLLRLADAEKNYLKLYELSYHDTTWMERVALTRARQGQKAGMLAAVKSAFIENRPERPDNFFAAAARLENWGYVAEARQYAEQGAAALGTDLPAQSEYAVSYAGIMARSRQYEAAFKRLSANGTDPEKAPALGDALRQMGRVAGTYFTPEEKTAFAAFLERTRSADSRLGLEAARAAGLEELAAKWLDAMLAANPSDVLVQNQYAENLTRRLRNGELGRRFEQLYNSMPPQAENREPLLSQAMEAYRRSGEAAAELRVIRLGARHGDIGQMAERMCPLLLAQPQTLLTVASSDAAGDMRDLAANCVVEGGKSADALAVIAARGKVFPPVWTSAYTALAGLFFAIDNPQVRSAFALALGSPVIGENIGKPVDRDRQLAGQPWFYYASRYGEYLAMTRQANAADYLPALVESAPWSNRRHEELGDYYRDAGDTRAAVAEYTLALELDAEIGSAHDNLAELYWAAGRKDDANAEYRRALESYIQTQDRGPAQASFTNDVRTTLVHIGRRDLLATLRPEADRLLKTWLRRNGTYMFEPLLEGILGASGDPAKGVKWLTDLSQATGDPLSILGRAVRNQLLPDAQRDLLYQKLIDANQSKLSASFGQPRETAEQALRSWQTEYIRSLLDRKQAARALAVLNTIPVKTRKAGQAEYASLAIQIAGLSGDVPALLARYAIEADPPPVDALRAGANELNRRGVEAAARRVLEFIYTRELEAHHFDSANFLGLAEIRLAEGDSAGATELLRRMTMLCGAPFETQASAAALLARFGKTAEAAGFLEQLVKAVPWDMASRAKWAELAANSRELTNITSDSNTSYVVRADAAVALRKMGGAKVSTGSAELDLLASSAPLTELGVNKPYWRPARLEAAAVIKDGASKARTLILAIGADPTPVAPRVDLFRTQLSLKRYQQAIWVLPDDTQSSANIPDNEAIPEYLAGSFLRDTPLTAVERASVSKGLGEAWRNLGDPTRASYFYRLAMELDKSPALKAAIQADLDLVRKAVALRRENNERRPVISKNLEQPHTVRPKLAAGGAR
ncbi:MAG: hypothetical protein JSU00_07120 [Acidobacteria bacterium]|nr:hypothetical protein [Acidobacteriota bacterium]